ncbi:MAG: hypothetical protein HXS47_11070 [Theionarchaea archaeon]|nr:hypothetical protein [Theionarchaea archaeon]
MSESELQEKAVKIFEALFDNRDSVEIDGTTYPIKRTSQTHLRSVKGEDYFYVEQNPEKASSWAKMAREGHNILWIIDGSDYIAQVRDGTFYDFR